MTKRAELSVFSLALAQKKSNKKSSFNKYNECGTIELVYRVKRTVGKILLLCLTVFVFSVFICYLDCGSEALYLDDMSKELLVSQLQMKVNIFKNNAIIKNMAVTVSYSDAKGMHEMDLREMKPERYMVIRPGKHRIHVEV